MRGEVNRRASFGDHEASQRIPPNHFLLEMERQVDWTPIEDALGKLFESGTGRASYPPIVMFKVLLLEQWYGLSDPGCEEALMDRLSFQRFAGLSLRCAVPDETTICRFRGRLAKNGLGEKCFGLVEEMLREKGWIVKRGTLVDATLVQSAKRAPNRQGEGGDAEAKWGRKSEKAAAVHGYKVHAGVDEGSAMIRKVEVTAANRNDGEVFEELLSGDEKSVFGDKAYAKDERKRELRAMGIYCGIMEKGRRGRRLGKRQKKRNAPRARVRGAVERTFGIMKRHYGYARMRYAGLMRNRNAVFLVCIAINLKRMVRLEAEARERCAA